MKREVLFRGKRVDNGEWVYGDLIHTPENKTRIIWFEPMYSDGIDFYNYFNCLVQKETIGQFTGLLDKNGVKIFEGDVLRFQTFGFEPETFETTIQFTKGSFNLENGRSMFYFGQKDFSKMDDAKIIGNIHE